MHVWFLPVTVFLFRGHSLCVATFPGANADSTFLSSSCSRNRGSQHDVSAVAKGGPAVASQGEGTVQSEYQMCVAEIKSDPNYLQAIANCQHLGLWCQQMYPKQTTTEAWHSPPIVH